MLLLSVIVSYVKSIIPSILRYLWVYFTKFKGKNGYKEGILPIAAIL
jgi:hypothetical protein